MLTAAIENIMKQGKRLEKIMFVVTEVDWMNPDGSLDEELIICDTIEKAIKDRLKPKGQTEGVRLVTILHVWTLMVWTWKLMFRRQSLRHIRRMTGCKRLCRC